MSAEPRVSERDETRREREQRDAAVRFYALAADEADLLSAARVQGLDGEVAELRLLLKRQIDAGSPDVVMILRSAEAVVRAVAARYRMSRKRADDMASIAVAAIEHLVPQFEDPPAETDWR
jgi:hypothetical protein